jgi:hypothetical protein
VTFEPREARGDPGIWPLTGPSSLGACCGPSSWRETIDGWVQNTEIRLHALIALGMVLIAGVIAVGFVTGIIGGIVQAVLPTIIAKVLGGTVWVGGTRLLGLAPTSRETTATWRASLGQRCRGTSWALASRAGAAVDIDERESPQSRFPPPPAYGPVAISGPPQATQPVSRQNLRSAHQPSLFTSEDFHRSSKSRARKYTSPSPCGPNENPGSLRQRLACLGHIACDRAAHTAHSVNQGRLGTLAPALVELRNRKIVSCLYK